MAHERVRELVAHVASRRQCHQQLCGHRLVDRVQHDLVVAADGGLKHGQVEAQPDHCGSGEHFGGPRGQPLEPSADHQTDAFRHVQLVDREVATPGPRRVEEPVFFGQVLEDLGGEEGIAVGLRKHCPDQLRGRVGAAELGEQRRQVVRGQPLERQAAGKRLAHQPGEALLERLSHVELDVAVGAEHQDRKVRQVRGKVFEQ